ncbi:Aldehyde dehydrogenase family 3 member H1, partial [Cucurbita argyrosperma subsp. argyrosperma]
MSEVKVFDATAATELVKELRGTFASGRTRSYEWRVSQLESILKLSADHEEEISDAIHSDLSKPALESIIHEVFVLKLNFFTVESQKQNWRDLMARNPLESKFYLALADCSTLLLDVPRTPDYDREYLVPYFPFTVDKLEDCFEIVNSVQSHWQAYLFTSNKKLKEQLWLASLQGLWLSMTPQLHVRILFLRLPYLMEDLIE